MRRHDVSNSVSLRGSQTVMQSQTQSRDSRGTAAAQQGKSAFRAKSTCRGQSMPKSARIFFSSHKICYQLYSQLRIGICEGSSMKLHEAMYAVPLDVLFVETPLRDVRCGARRPRLLLFDHMSPEVLKRSATPQVIHNTNKNCQQTRKPTGSSTPIATRKAAHLPVEPKPPVERSVSSSSSTS